MKSFNRRQVCAAFPALAAVGTGAVSAFAAQTAATENATMPTPAGAGTLGAARAISLEQMQERKTENVERWSILNGTLATGETVNLRQSMQVEGTPAPPLHVIQHTEFILVREGEVEFQHEVSGKTVTERAVAGGVIYIPPGTRHAIRNAGAGPARYFIMSIGGDAK